MVRRAGPVAVLLALLLIGCGSSGSAASSTEQRLQEAGFGCRTLTVTGEGRAPRADCVWVADTPALQGRGLMGVDDPGLGGRPGMAFVFDPPVEASFWMKDTPLPLTLVWVGKDGRVLGTRDLEPCSATSGSVCTPVSPPGPLSMAIEVPRGRAPALGLVPGASVSLGAPC
ncbi:MAG: DUF192 domain-containing protein [Acidimicrobiia bacterium]|nr:DUF192 domain-containing protein [Acidimicrobiia bacterium]